MSSKPTDSAAKFPIFTWMRGVARDKRIAVIFRLVLLRLCLYRDEKNSGQCNPGYQTIADELLVGRASVFRAVDVAIRRGWIAAFPHGGRTKRNFVFTFPDNPQQSHGGDGPTVSHKRRSKRPTVSGKRANSLSGARQQSQAILQGTEPASEFATNGQREWAKRTGSKSQTQPADSGLFDSGQDAQPIDETKASGGRINVYTKKSGVNDDRPASDPDDSGFAEFWLTFPKKKAKGRARNAYVASIKRGATPAQLLAGAQRCAAERIAAEPTDLEKRERYTPNPARWLHDDGHLDESPSAAGAVTIDNSSGNVIETPPPPRRPSRPQSVAEAGEEMLAEEAARAAARRQSS